MPNDFTERNPRGGSTKEVRGMRCTACGRTIGSGEGYEVDHGAARQVRHTIRLYVDECAPGLRRILNRMGFCVAAPMPQGTQDTEWLARAGRENLVVLTQDAQIVHNNEEMRTIIDNRVRCFILPGWSRGTWDQVRRIAAAWDKIRGEAEYPGPFVWHLDERDSHPWKQLYPEPRQDYKPPDFSRTPVGHLLNLFADAVCQHDNGWFSELFIQRLHDHIRREIEARISRDRSGVPTVAPGESLLGAPVRVGQEHDHQAELTTPLDTSGDAIIEFNCRTDDNGPTYQWLVPARRLGFYLRNQDAADTDDDAAFAFQAGATGFHRCGFGLRIRKP